ncbi:peptidase M15, partial [Streptomyces cyaneofuscatus]
MSAALIAALAGALAPATSASAAPATIRTQTPAPDMAGIVAALESASANGAPGAMARYSGPDGVRTRAVGVRDRESGAAMDTRARFRVGSVSKT